MYCGPLNLLKYKGALSIFTDLLGIWKNYHITTQKWTFFFLVAFVCLTERQKDWETETETGNDTQYRDQDGLM